MLEFQEKQKTRKLIYSNWSLIILSIAAVLMFFSLAKIYVKSREAKAKNEEIINILEAAKERGLSIKEGIERLEGEFGAEKEIRDRFDVAKPGEKAIVIINRSEETPSPPEKKESFILKLWHVINIFD